MTCFKYRDKHTQNMYFSPFKFFSESESKALKRAGIIIGPGKDHGISDLKCLKCLKCLKRTKVKGKILYRHFRYLLNKSG